MGKDIILNPSRSWLCPIGRAAMFVANLILNQVGWMIFTLTPKDDKEHLPNILPVLRDDDTFTK